MKILPIEPGCKAITIKCYVPQNIGKSVVVKRYLGRVEGLRGRRWQVDKKFIGRFTSIITSAEEHQLLRIDGNEDQFEKEDLGQLMREVLNNEQ